MLENKHVPELPLEEMAGEIVPSLHNKKIQIINEVNLSGSEPEVISISKLLELAKKLAAEEGVKIGTKIAFDDGKKATIFGLEVSSGSTGLLNENDVQNGEFRFLIDISKVKSKSGKLELDNNLSFSQLKAGLKNGKISII